MMGILPMWMDLSLKIGKKFGSTVYVATTHALQVSFWYQTQD
jgi:hypothetical protein